jgi:5-methylcytosine-specific restriction endonuclease McrA
MKLQTLKSRVQMLQAPAKVATEVNPSSWRTSDQSAAQRGYGHKWRVARLGYLAKHPLCVFCLREGEHTAATVVDHSIPHRGDMVLFWKSEHWQSLCKACHDSEAQKRDKATG